MTPMWLSWINPGTQKRERIYNYRNPDTPAGQVSIRLAKEALAERFGLVPSKIPGFKVELAPWLSPEDIAIARDTANKKGEEPHAERT